MNRIRKLAVVIVTVASASLAQSEQITINFDNFVVSSAGDEPGTSLTDQFKSDGVIFDRAWIHGGLSALRGSPPNWVSGDMFTNDLMNPGVVSGFFIKPGDASEDATTNYVEVQSMFVDSDTTVTLDVFASDGRLLASESRTGSRQ
jgi:hypothetical protein